MESIIALYKQFVRPVISYASMASSLKHYKKSKFQHCVPPRVVPNPPHRTPPCGSQSAPRQGPSGHARDSIFFRCCRLPAPLPPTPPHCPRTQKHPQDSSQTLQRSPQPNTADTSEKNRKMMDSRAVHRGVPVSITGELLAGRAAAPHCRVRGLPPQRVQSPAGPPEM